VVQYWSTCPTTDAAKWRGDRFAAHGVLVEYYYGGPEVTTPAQLLITTAGLPLLGVQGVMKNECGIRSTSGQLNGSRGAMIMRTAFPYSPLFPGFAINTVFYAAILWVLFAFPFALRRRRRIKRGLCVGCGYPVGLSQVCSECGRVVTHSVAAHGASGGRPLQPPRANMMLRRIFQRILLFLLLGAILNIALAWIIEIVVDKTRPLSVENRLRITEGSTLHDVETFARWGATDHSSAWTRLPVEVPWRRMEGNEDILNRWPDFSEPLENFRNGTQQAEIRNAGLRGWPMLALWGETRWYVQANGNSSANEAHGSLRLPATRSSSFIFPLRPLWPGFAINTVFYAAVLWLPFAAFGRIRRRRRIKRGLCVRCGYPIAPGRSAACSECGTPIALHGASGATPCNPREQT